MVSYMCSCLRLLLVMSAVLLAGAGYSAETLMPLIRIVKEESLRKVETLSMLELGNQEVHDKETAFYYPFYDEGFLSHTFSTRYFFQHLGVDYTSVDLNGLDGAIRADCREPLTKVFNQSFDIITNIGFTEHVGEGDVKENVFKHQYTIFKSMHDLCRVGGILFHDFMVQVPAHGVVNYRLSFLQALAESNNYSIPLRPVQHDQRFGSDTLIFMTAYRRESEQAFIPFEEFVQLPGLVAIHDTYGHHKRLEVFFTDEASGRRVRTISVDEELDPKRSWRLHASEKCAEYFEKTPEEGNVYLRSGGGFVRCVDSVEEGLSKTIESFIAS